MERSVVKVYDATKVEKKEMFLSPQSCAECPDKHRKSAEVCDGMFSCLIWFETCFQSGK